MQRAVYWLYFGEQPMRQSEIARLFGVSQSAISRRISRMRTKFEDAHLVLCRQNLRPDTVGVQGLASYN